MKNKITIFILLIFLIVLPIFSCVPEPAPQETYSQDPTNTFGDSTIFTSPKHIAIVINPSKAGGHVIITDTYNNGTANVGRGQVFDLATKNLQNEFEAPSSDPIGSPQGIDVVVDEAKAGGHVIITDTYNNGAASRLHSFQFSDFTQTSTYHETMDTPGNNSRASGIKSLGVVPQKFSYETLIVVDNANNQIQIIQNEMRRALLSPDKITIYNSDGMQSGEVNFGLSGFLNPTDIALSDDVNVNIGESIETSTLAGRAFVTDSNNNRIIKIVLSEIKASEPNPLNIIKSYGEEGPQNGKFNNPTGIAYDEGFVYVADTGNKRVQKFKDDENFTFYSSFGKDVLQEPRTIAIDGDIVYVVDTALNKVFAFKKDTVK